jgi:hypothetical protein
MPTKLSCGIALALVCLALLPTTQNAAAITVELAKKCRALTDKAFPLRVPGELGREHGTGKEVQDYFSKCVLNGGNIGEQSLEPGSHAKVPKEGGDEGDRALPKMRTFPDGLI